MLLLLHLGPYPIARTQRSIRLLACWRRDIMSSEPEDLLENAFFLTLKARYPRLYHLAEEKGFAICVPQDSIARALRITDEVAGMHGEV